jgi:hypothetical protein
LVGQLPSHSSPASTIPLPHLGAQSESFVLSHPAGQQLSPFTHCVWVPAGMQAAWQVPAPLRVKRLQPCAGHEVGQVDVGSQVSPGSRRPLPQPAQSTSVVALQWSGQQPSAVVPLQAVALHCGEASASGPPS